MRQNRDMRFIGCKKDLMPFLSEFVKGKQITGGVFCDLFAGTAAVGRHFKAAGFRVFSTDLLYFSFVLQKAYLELNAYPSFAKLLPRLGMEAKGNGDLFLPRARGAKAAVEYLNNLGGDEGFIFRHYSPEGTKGERHQRCYLTADNAKKIDAIRRQIEEWKNTGQINDAEFYYLLCALIEAVPFVSNISGTYAAFLKSWDKRALKPLHLTPPIIIRGRNGNRAAHMNGLDFVGEAGKMDVLYLDPPYNARQYAPNYHILETIARNDSPIVKGVSGMRDYRAEKSEFCSRTQAMKAFNKILERADYRHLIVSYNEEGILSQDHLIGLLERHGKVEMIERDYQRFKSNSNGSGHGRVKERIYYSKWVHPQNTLNDFGGAEWLFFQKSVDATNYSTKGEDGFAHDLRKIHPSPKPPQLMRKFVEFFTKENQTVLDPFMGVGGVLLACSQAGRQGVGIDLSTEYVECYKAVCKRLKIKQQRNIVGDSLRLTSILKNPPIFDLVLTDPPYGEMLTRKRTGERKKKSGFAEATPFTDSKYDLGNMDREQFLEALRGVIEQSTNLLKQLGYIVIFAKDMQPNEKKHNMLHCEVAETILKIPGISFRGYKIWVDQTPKLYPFGYPHAFVANQLHQFALIFRKEKK